jgi:hypothetical protein
VLLIAAELDASCLESCLLRCLVLLRVAQCGKSMSAQWNSLTSLICSPNSYESRQLTAEFEQRCLPDSADQLSQSLPPPPHPGCPPPGQVAVALTVLPALYPVLPPMQQTVALLLLPHQQ